MLESLAASVLNRFLGDYVANLEQNQLNIAIWSGDVVLKNLQLKKEALDKFNLPIDVLEGYVGELILNIPWSNLKNKPVKVFINNVYILAVPKAETEDDPDEIERRAQQLKQEQLANAELLHTSHIETTEEDQKNQSFMTKLVTKIVDNLQISINNIHIRYEDKLSDPGHPFAVGFTLSEFSAVSTDSNWKPAFIEGETSSINKLVTLGSLAIYWNTDSKSLAGSTTKESIEKFTSLIASEQKIPQEHQYILKPVSGTGRITLNKFFELNTPKTTAILLFDELGFILDDEQYRDALLMADLFHFYLRQQQYQKFRPPKDVTPKKDPRAWLQFAGNCIISEIRERNRKFTWEFFKERRDDRHDYVKFYKDKQFEKITPENATKLEALERKLSYEDILFYRSIAKSQLKKERALIAKKKKEQQQQALSTRKSSGWFSGWWYGGGSTDSSENETVWTDEQLQELYEAIEYDESEAAPEAVELPKEWTKLLFKTELKTGSFVLKKDPHGKSTEILSLIFDTVTAKFLQRPDSFQAETTLGSLSVYDGSTEGTLYPQIVKVKEDVIGDINPDEPSNNPFFQLVFEHNPLDGRADNGLSLKMRHLEVVYNQNAIGAVTEFFRPPEQQLETITALIEAAGDTFEGLKAQTRAVLEMKLEEHKTIDVEVDMNAPIIIVPKSCTQSNTEVVVLDSGHIRVESKLVSKADKEEIQSKANSDYNEADYKRLESLMYDRFSVQLSSTQLLVGQSVERCLAQIRNSELKYDLHVIDRINLQFLVEMSILPRAPNLTKFRISGHLPLLKTNFSDRKYKIIMSIVETVTSSSSSSSSSNEEVPKIESTDKSTFAKVANDLLKENKNTKSRGWERAKHIDHNMIAKLGLGKPQDLVLIDSESDEDAPEEHNEEFFDAQDANVSSAKMNQRMFEFEFKVDKFSTTIKKADIDPDKPEVILVDMVLEHFGLTYVLRPFDMSAEVVLKSLSVEDKMTDTGSEFKHLAASEGYGNAQADDSKDLVHIKYTRVDKKSPEYMSKFEGISQSVDIEMSTINIIVTRKSILTLYNFVLDTFTSSAAPSSPQSDVETEALISSESQNPQPSQTSTMRVKVTLNSIRFILNNDGVRLATGLLYRANVAVLLLQNTIRVGARLGSFSLSDDLANSDESLRQLLTLQGEEDLAVFRYETYDESASGYPGYDSSVSLSTGSAKLTFLEEPIRLLLDFGSKFAQMKGLYDSARRAAVSQAVQLQEKVSKFHFDICIRSPIIVFPQVNTKDAVIANLGEFSASNKFESKDGNKSYLTRITAELQKISLSSNFMIPNTSSPQILQIINDVDINFKISYSEHVEGSEGPDMKIIGEMSDVKMNLTEKQYKFLFDLSNTVSRAFSSPEEQAPISPQRRITDPTQTPPQSKTPNASTVVDNSSKIEGEGQPWVTVGLVFEVNQIYLEIFTDDGSKERILGETSLSRFSLNQTKIEYKMLSDNSMKAVLQIQSVTLSDTRPNIKNVYRDILPKVSLGEPQFLIDLSMSGVSEKNIIALVKFRSPKVILTLDHLFATRNYFMSAFGTSSSSNETTPKAQSSDTLPPLKPPRPKTSPTTTQPPTLPPRPVATQPQQTTSLSYSVEIDSAEIILLANPHLTSSDAVVLSSQKMVLVQQSVIWLKVDQVGMFLCQMDKRESTLLRFIDNFDLSLTMNTQSSKPEQQITDINVEVGALILRVSYRDALLILSIVNKVSELSSQPSSSASIEQSETKVENPTDNVRPSNTPSRSFNYNTLTATKKSSNSSKIRAAPVVSRESLKVKLKGARLILIGDEHDIPMIDGSCDKIDVGVVNWSSQLSVDANVSTYVNYFNLTNSHWEPLIEPWQYSVHALKQTVPESMVIDITSQKRLEVNVTHIFLETMLTTLSLINHESDEHLTNTPRGSRTPYILRNKTGYNMSVWAISSADANDTEVKVMNDGQELDWRFDDWRKMREMMAVTKNMLGIQFEGSNWKCIKDIPVDREGETLYILRPKLNEVFHRLVVDVKLVNNIKVVTFRSALVVENRTNLTMELLVVDTSGNHVSKVYQIGSGEDCPIPIEAAYYHKFKIRPDGGFGYDWSMQRLYWKEFLKPDFSVTTVLCHSIQDNNDVPFRFQVFPRYQKKNPLVKEYPCMAITLSAPIQIENLLPYDIVFRINDDSLKQDFPGNRLEKGQVTSLHLIDSVHVLALNIEEISDTAFKKSGWAIINSPNKEHNIEKTLTVTDDKNLELKLRIHYYEIPDSGGAFKISIYSPYVMVNKTGLDMAFRSKSLFSSAKDTAGQGFVSRKEKNQKVAPYMFSYADDNNQNRALLKVGDSEWSKPLSFEAVGTFLEVVISSTSSAEEIHLGVSIQEGVQKYKLTKIVTFTPRFIIKNNLSNDLIFREPEATNETCVKAKNREPLHFLKQKQLVLRYHNSNSWSAPINIDELGRVHLKLEKSDSELDLIRTEVLLEDATVFVIFNHEDGIWPYRVENYSDVDVVFYQQEPSRRELFGGSSSQPASSKKYTLKPGNGSPYSWDYPAHKEKRLVLKVNDHERVVNIQEIGSLLPFKCSANGVTHILAIEVAADGPTQVLLLSNYNQSESLYRPKAPSVTSSNTDSSAFEVIDVDSVITLTFQIRLEGIGISVINKRMQELAYASVRGLEFTYNDSTLYQSINFFVKWLQIDNQLYGGIYPIILYPTVIPKDANDSELVHPAFHASLTKAKDDSHGVIYFKYFSMLLQEMTFEIDEDFLFALLDFTKIQGFTTQEPDAPLIDGTLDIPEPKTAEGDNQLYFEVLHINPMKINISFVRTERINVENKPAPRNPIMFFFNVLTMAIGNINDAPIKLNALVMENMRVSFPVLIDRIRQHYGEAFIYQVHKIVGSADFLGNPVGLFNNLSSGVVDIFYEPYQGIVMSDRPQDLGIGIARGATSFVKKTVYGVSDSVSKFTGSIGKGLAAATLDKTFQDRRRMSQYKNRPKHAFYGVAQGANSLVTSIGSGFEGLVRKPIEGVEKEGATGLIKGVGKGLVGFVTKPVVGILDLTSNITAGIRNTTTVFDENEIVPARSPRYVGRDGILRPYQQREALGQSWLKQLEDGKYFNDEYVAHLGLLGNDQIIMLTRTRMMLVKTKKRGLLKVDWEVPFSDLQAINLQSTGILLTLRGNNTGPFIPISEQSDKEWFEKQVEQVINELNAEKKANVTV